MWLYLGNEMNVKQANSVKIGDKVVINKSIMTVVRITSSKVFVATATSSMWFSK